MLLLLFFRLPLFSILVNWLNFLSLLSDTIMIYCVCMYKSLLSMVFIAFYYIFFCCDWHVHLLHIRHLKYEIFNLAVTKVDHQIAKFFNYKIHHHRDINVKDVWGHDDHMKLVICFLINMGMLKHFHREEGPRDWYFR